MTFNDAQDLERQTQRTSASDEQIAWVHGHDAGRLAEAKDILAEVKWTTQVVDGLQGDPRKALDLITARLERDIAKYTTRGR